MNIAWNKTKNVTVIDQIDKTGKICILFLYLYLYLYVNNCAQATYMFLLQ